MLRPPGSILVPPFSFGPSLKHPLTYFAPFHSPVKRCKRKFYPIPQLSAPYTPQEAPVPLEAVTLASLPRFPGLPLVGFLLETMVCSFSNNPGNGQIRAPCLN